MAESGITPNVSQQYLMANDQMANQSSVEAQPPKKSTGPSLRAVTASEWTIVLVLCFVNLINYMDRFTIAGEFPPVPSVCVCGRGCG